MKRVGSYLILRDDAESLYRIPLNNISFIKKSNTAIVGWINIIFKNKDRQILEFDMNVLDQKHKEICQVVEEFWMSDYIKDEKLTKRLENLQVQMDKTLEML